MIMSCLVIQKEWLSVENFITKDSIENPKKKIENQSYLNFKNKNKQKPINK
jgi:hypothetical protein